MTGARRGGLFQGAASDLQQVADGLVRVAKECREVAIGIESEQPELLKLQAVSLQTESMRAAMTSLLLRGVAERLAVVSQIDSDERDAQDAE